MASGLGSLGDDDVAAVALQPDRLGHGRRRRHHDRTGGADSIDELGRGQTEVEADDFRTTPFDEPAGVVVERVPRRPGDACCSVDAELRVEARQRRRTTRRAARRDLRCRVAEEVDVQRRVRRVDGTRRSARRVARSSASPPAANPGRRLARPRRPAQHRSQPAIGACTMGNSIPSRARAHHRRTPREPYLWPSSRLLRASRWG